MPPTDHWRHNHIHHISLDTATTTCYTVCMRFAQYFWAISSIIVGETKTMSTIKQLADAINTVNNSYDQDLADIYFEIQNHRELIGDMKYANNNKY